MDKKRVWEGNKIVHMSFILFLILFIIISIVFVNPVQENTKAIYRSSDLKKVVNKDKNIVKTEYVNEKGEVTVAANLGYATKVVTTTEEGETESYYDALGTPVARYSSYYKIFREYDDKGNNIRITFLDDEENPVMYEGYTMEERTFNDDKQITKVKYYNEHGYQISTKLYGYGKMYEYDNYGNARKITYVNEQNNPVITALGYASVVRTFYMTNDLCNGKVNTEFYYNEFGNPITCSLGQYGLHKEYDENGLPSVLTYLDAEGKPLVTNKGYTTIKRKYMPDDTISSEMYYDMNGNPLSLAEGQYGVSYENGQIRYLDQDGKEKFNVRNLLYNYSWSIYIIASILVVVSTYLEKKPNMILLVLYLSIIIYLTLMYRENGDFELRLIPFRRYSSFLTSSETRAEIIRNIWLFVPLGAILYQLNPRKGVLFASFLLSVGIETLQYFTGTGFCELDDVLHNCLGALIGFGLGNIAKQRMNKGSSRNNTIKTLRDIRVMNK